MSARSSSWAPRAPLVAFLLGLAGACGTRVLELPGGPDAGADTSPASCVTQKGPLGEPCTMCYFADGRPLGGDCIKVAPAPGVPPCPPSTGPLADPCSRCSVFAYPGKGKITTCLACKPWEKTPTSACRTCAWSDVPLEATCQQCLDANGGAADSCDQVLQKVQLAL